MSTATKFALAALVCSAQTVAAQVKGDPPPPPLAVLEVLGSPATTVELLEGLGQEHEVIQHKVVNPNGQEVVTKLPGRLKYTDLALRRTATDSTFEDWRDAVRNGSGFERNATLTILDPDTGDTIATFALQGAWPSSYSLSDGGDAGATTLVETVILVVQSIQRIP